MEFLIMVFCAVVLVATATYLSANYDVYILDDDDE